MGLKTRKLNLIESLIQIEDENLFLKIESLIKDQDSEGRDIEPFTRKKLLERAAKSNKDLLAGRVTTQEDLEDQSENW